MIHMILYEEESKGSMTREDIYKMARALSRDTLPSSKRLPKYPPYQQFLQKVPPPRARWYRARGSTVLWEP